MTPVTIRQVAIEQIAQLEKAGYAPVRYRPDRYLAEANEQERLQHALYLFHNVVRYVSDGNLGKANRHLGAAQTILSFASFATVDESRQQNQR